MAGPVGERAKVVAWVASHVMPHEGAVRAWLARSAVPQAEIDDLIQEAYCKLAELASFEHVSNPRNYFFMVARNLLNDQLRRARIVRIETAAELENFEVFSDEPSPERVVSGRQELARVERLITGLPERTRRVLLMRKVDGLPQKEIAAKLGVTEGMVENEAIRAIQLLLKAIRKEEGHGRGKGDDYGDRRPRNRRRH